MKHSLTKPLLALQLASAETGDAQHLNAPLELAFENSKDRKAPEWVQVFPKGPDLATVDGRSFKLTDVAALAAKLNAKSRHLMIDYDHKSAFMPEDGGDQTAAGWMTEFEDRNGILWAKVEWTTSAAAKVSDLEYRYFSPEFNVDAKTGEVIDLLAAGLVNKPAFVMQALASAKSKSPTKKHEEPMLKEIAKALGLPDDATEKQILAAIEKKDGDHKTELAAAQAEASTPSVEKFMPRADYDKVLARATAAEKKLGDAEAEAFKEKVTASIDQAVKDGKIVPASKDHYLSLCSDEAALKKVLDAVGASPEIGKGSDIKGDPKGSETVLTSEEKDMAASLGVSEEDFLKTRNAA